MHGGPDDEARGADLGRQLAQPRLLDVENIGWVEPLVRVAFEAGVATRDLQPPLSDSEAFYRGVMSGMREAAVALRRAHAQRALCDPDAPENMCEYCQAYHGAIRCSRSNQQRWWREGQEAARRFAVLRSNKIHTRDCPAVVREVAAAEHGLSTLTPADARHGGEVLDWPRLVTHQEAVDLNRRRCRTCAPDVPERKP